MNIAVKKTILLFSVILLLVITTFSFAVWYHEDPVERVQFSLIDQHQQTITNKHLVGRHLVVFFGYTSCPDICPTQLFKLDQAIRMLEGQGKSNGLVPVFITVDPERDTEEKIKSYLAHFHQSFVGLTGSRAQLKKATDSFHTLLQDPPETIDENYLIAHSSLFYVVDQYGRIVDNIPFKANVSDIVKQLNHFI